MPSLPGFQRSELFRRKQFDKKIMEKKSCDVCPKCSFLAVVKKGSGKKEFSRQFIENQERRWIILC